MMRIVHTRRVSALFTMRVGLAEAAAVLLGDKDITIAFKNR